MKRIINILAIAAAVAVSSLWTASAQAPVLVDASSFDTVVDGKQVGLYTITNGTITAQITNYCGYIVGVFTPDKDGNYANIVGHNETFDQYKGFSRNPCGATLGRFANRIANGSFTLDGVEYQLTKNNGAHTLHGGRQGFDHTVWDVESVQSDKLVFSTTLADGLDGFPGNFKTVLTFSITEDNALSIEYKAETDKPTVCNLSHHVYFNLNGAGNSDVLGHMLTIDADNITETDETLIPTGKIIPVDGTVFDFRQPVRIGDRQAAVAMVWGQPAPEIPEGMVRSYDQNFCLNHGAAKEVGHAATLYSPETGRQIDMFNNHPGVQIYTGNRAAIAMESQMYPDTPNHLEFPSAVLRPGETYSHTIIYRFSVR